MYHELTCQQMYKQQLQQLHYTSSQLITYNKHKKQFVLAHQGKLIVVGEEGTEYVGLPAEWALWVVEWLEADIYAVWAEWVEEGCYMHGVWVVQAGQLLLGWKAAFEAGVYVVMDKCTIVYCGQTKTLTCLHLNSKHSAIRHQCSVPPSSPLQSQAPISPTSAISLHPEHSTVFPHRCSSKTFSYEQKKFVGKGEQPLREKFSFHLGVEEEGWHVSSLHEYPQHTELLLSKHQQYMLVLWWREENKVVKGRGKVQGKVMGMVDAGGCKLLVGEDEDSVKVWLLGGQQHQFRVLNSMSIEGVKYSKVLVHNDSISVITQPFTPSNELLPLPIIYRVNLIPKHILYCQMLQQLQIVQDSQLQSLLQQLHQILA